LISIKRETWDKFPLDSITTETVPSRKFLADTLAMLKTSNPYLFSFIFDLVMGKKIQGLRRETGFDTALGGAIISRLLQEEGKLPYISSGVSNKVLSEVRDNPTAFHSLMMSTVLDKYISMTVALCSGNYEATGYPDEARVIQVGILTVYKMIEVQHGES
jgi:hypothetical protein